MDIKYTWDAGRNLTQRENLVASETETFTYDFLDRLTSASGPYSESYTYDPIGNITSKGGLSYTYGTKPHAVTAVGSTSYAYDYNGNMVTRGSQTLTWDAENRLTNISDNGTMAQFVYDGDGNRIKKTEGGETILYINKYYEKNLTTDEVTTSYYLGSQLIAQRQGTDLQYVHQDHLGGTSVMSDSSGNQIGYISYFPFGATRSGSVPTDKKFTGQRLDGTGLYYYGARYYDAEIGRFISVDPIIPNVFNPQSINPYSYCLNNPLKYVDPSGCQGEWGAWGLAYGIANNGSAYGAEGNYGGWGSAYGIANSRSVYGDWGLAYGMANVGWAALPTTLAIPAGAGLTADAAAFLAALTSIALPLVGTIAIVTIVILVDRAMPSSYVYSVSDHVTEAYGIDAAAIDPAGSMAAEESAGPAEGNPEGEGAKGEADKGEAKSEGDRPTIEDCDQDPENWIKEPDRWEDATKKEWKGGKCLEERRTHKETGKVVERQTIFDKSGKIVHQHPRYKYRGMS